MVEVIWTDKTKKSFAYALENAFVGKTVSTHDRYLHSVEAECKGPGKPRIKLYADQLVDSFAKVKKTVEDNKITNINLDQFKVAYSPIPIKEHAFPTPHREAKDYPLYLITHKRMYRNQSGNTAQNPILNFAIGADAAENFIAVNAATGKELGIKDGDHGGGGKPGGQGQGQGEADPGHPSRYHCRVLSLWPVEPGLPRVRQEGHLDQPGAGTASGSHCRHEFVQRHQVKLYKA